MIPIEIILGISALILAVAGIAQIRFAAPRGGNPMKADLNAAGEVASKLKNALYAVWTSKEPAYFAKGSQAVLSTFGKYQKFLGQAAQSARYRAGLLQKQLGAMYKKYMQNFRQEYARPIIEEVAALDSLSKNIGGVMSEAYQLAPIAEAYGKGVIPVDQARKLGGYVIQHYAQGNRLNAEIANLRKLL
jgi:hypothetical protein